MNGTFTGPRLGVGLLLLSLVSSACSSGASSKSSPNSRGGAAGRVVEVDQLPQTHRDLLRAYGAGGEEWERARTPALEDPALTRFLVENLFLELVRAHRSLGGRDGDRALRARDRARAELARIGAPAAPTLAAALEVADEVSAELAAQTLGAIGRPALPALIEALAAQQPNARQRAALALARMPHGAREEPRVREALIRASADKEWFVRAQVARALGSRGVRDTETAPWRAALEKLLVDGDEAVVEAAASGLVELADPQAIPALISALERATDEAELRRFRALQGALQRLGGVGPKPTIAAWHAWWRENRARLAPSK